MFESVGETSQNNTKVHKHSKIFRRLDNMKEIRGKQYSDNKIRDIRQRGNKSKERVYIKKIFMIKYSEVKSSNLL